MTESAGTTPDPDFMGYVATANCNKGTFKIDWKSASGDFSYLNTMRTYNGHMDAIASNGTSMGIEKSFVFMVLPVINHACIAD